MNLIDLAFSAFVAFYAYRGFHRGLIREGLDLLGFALGAALALRFYFIPAYAFRALGMSRGWANLVGGILLFVVFLAAAVVVSNRIHAATGDSSGLRSMKVGGATLAALWSGAFAAFMLVVLTVIPSPVSAQRAVHRSFLGQTVLASDSPVYPALEHYARDEARNVLFYLRQYFAQLEPKKDDLVEEEYFKLQPSSDIKIDEAAEKAILEAVNKERASRGLKVLTAHREIQKVARLHSADMYNRGYFAHLNPDGKDPFQRMADGKVTFTYAGENLALAPTITMVHQGLMNSPRHKENILKPEFTDLGIGVYKGPYGLMVTQNFCAGCR
ncbi:MAG TPA: CvpA family protein [Actinomycetota bacterium]|nr:CvpA family protein [Actinomycetota bacterium]